VVADPVRSGSGYHVLEVIERQGEEVPPLAAVREEVVAEMRRRDGEQALRAYLADLRRRAAIEIRKP
jgi:parvulin-like peptidyl-prolyl isomerase